MPLCDNGIPRCHVKGCTSKKLKIIGVDPDTFHFIYICKQHKHVEIPENMMTWNSDGYLVK